MFSAVLLSTVQSRRTWWPRTRSDLPSVSQVRLQNGFELGNFVTPVIHVARGPVDLDAFRGSINDLVVMTR
jgi:hypothetical protein